MYLSVNLKKKTKPNPKQKTPQKENQKGRKDMQQK